MPSSNTLEDLDNSLRLLDEYTSRTKKLYTEITLQKQQRISFLYLFTAFGVFLTFAFMVLNDYLMRRSAIIYFLIGGFFMIFSFAFLFLFILRKNSSVASIKSQLSVTIKQLKELVLLVSQFTEHNTNQLSELKRYELNLRLIEAEETIFAAKRAINLKDYDKHNSRYF